MGLSSFLFGGPDPGVPVPMVLYSRPACSVCDEMKAVIETARFSKPFTLREVDVDSDRELKKRFGLRIPVLEIAGEVGWEGRVQLAQLEKAFSKIASRWRWELMHSESR